MIAFFVFLGLAARLQAQYYSPDTEYHDLAQRFFPVELARILAWREHAGDSTVAQITHRVRVNEQRRVDWEIQWLGPQTQTVHQVSIQYPESLLAQGPAFYREVFRQMWKAGWRPLPQISEDKLFREFWHGAHQVGFSRVEAVRTAWNMLDAAMPEERLAPRLAGLLQNAALPSLGGACTLDGLLLARGAAWLCLGEAMSAAPGKRLDACWAPVLFLAGREDSAAELWNRSLKDQSEAWPPNEIAHGWDFLLRRPNAEKAFLYAVQPGRERFALPLMMYYARVADLNTVLDDVLSVFCERNAHFQARFYDYGPYLSVHAGISGGRLLEGAWPALARKSWVEALNDLPAEHRDYDGYVPFSKAAVIGFKKEFADLSRHADASLAGLSFAAPLLRREMYEGVGKLKPVGAISSRDLIAYGWESSGVQMLMRYRFVRDQWGVPEVANAIWTNCGPSFGYFSVFYSGSEAEGNEFKKSLYWRLQYSDLCQENFKTLASGVWGQSLAEDATLFYRRCWLRPGQIPLQGSLLARHGPLPELLPMLKRQAAEGGPLVYQSVLQFLVRGMNDNTAGQIPGKQEFQEALARKLLEPTILQVNTLWEKQYEPMDSWTRGQALEKLFWEHPNIRIHSWIYNNYLCAHAHQSARRFYDQMSEFIREPVQFSNGLGKERYVQAYLEGDAAGMKKALSDCACGSMNHMIMLMWDACARDNLPELRRQIDEAIDRYDSARKSNSRTQRLKAFLPLIPALKNPADPGHAKALDYFADDSAWPVLQWIMIKQYQLGTPDAIRFLGGENTDTVRQFLAAYLQKDKPKFEKLFQDLARSDLSVKSVFALTTCLRNELLEAPVPQDQPDLKPKSATSLVESVLAAMEPGEEE